jgi:hypothetical protein
MKRNAVFFFFFFFPLVASPRATRATATFDARAARPRRVAILICIGRFAGLGTSHSINHVLLAPAHCLYNFFFLRRANTGTTLDINTCSGMTRASTRPLYSQFIGGNNRRKTRSNESPLFYRDSGNGTPQFTSQFFNLIQSQMLRQPIKNKKETIAEHSLCALLYEESKRRVV